jgi:hypothetical protein
MLNLATKCAVEHDNIRVIHRRHCERSAAIQSLWGQSVFGQSLWDQNNVAMFCVVPWICVIGGDLQPLQRRKIIHIGHRIAHHKIAQLGPAVF